MSFEYERKINYYETDKMGVVHHSNYIRFLEECRCIWLEQLNIPMKKLEAGGITIPVLEVNCQYKYHVTAGDTIIIKPSIIEFNGVRMTVRYDVKEKETGKTVIEATTKHCFTTIDLKPINLKKYNQNHYDIFQKLLKNKEFSNDSADK